MPASSLSISNITMLPGKAPAPLSQIRPNTRPVLAAPPSSATGGARMGPATPLLQHQQPRSAATSISPGLRGSAPPSQHPATTHMVQSTTASSIPAVAFPVTLRAPVSPAAAAAPNNGGGNSGGAGVRLQIPVSQQQQWGGLVTTGLSGAGTVRAPGAILTSGLVGGGGGGRPPPAANLLPVGSRAVTMAALNFRPQPVNARPPMSGGVAAAVKTATPSHLGAGGISAQLGAASQAALKPPSVSGSGGVTRLTAVTSTAVAAAGTGKLVSPITAAPMVSLTPATHIQVPLSVNNAAMRLETYRTCQCCGSGDVHPGSRIRIFSNPDPRTRSKNLSILTKKNCL
jgi:hypothetical protein